MQAEVLHKRALHIREQQLGAEHPDTASSLEQSGCSLSGIKGNMSNAEPLYQRALGYLRTAARS